MGVPMAVAATSQPYSSVGIPAMLAVASAAAVMRASAMKSLASLRQASGLMPVPSVSARSAPAGAASRNYRRSQPCVPSLRRRCEDTCCPGIRVTNQALPLHTPGPDPRRTPQRRRSLCSENLHWLLPSIARRVWDAGHHHSS